MGKAHNGCLKAWVEHKLTNVIDKGNLFTCEICKFHYNVQMLDGYNLGNWSVYEYKKLKTYTIFGSFALITIVLIILTVLGAKKILPTLYDFTFT